MKKNLKVTIIVILIFTLLIPITYSYALPLAEPEVEEKQFFEIPKTEVTKNEKVEMIINLDSINYNQFTFELKSDEVIENLEIAQSDEIETEKNNNNEIVMEINKEKTNVKTINLFYSVPENKNVGDTIKFIATITSNLNEEKEEISEEETELPTEKEEIDEEESQSIELEIKIVEEKNDDKQEDTKPEDVKPEDTKPEGNNSQTQMPSTVPNISNNYSNMQYNSMSNLSINNNQIQKVTYNGSDNNYLSELSVEGYTLNRTFSKENATYFITVEKEIETLNITAKADNEEAKICIYGNNNLKEGTNKILITVTAENGNVRNYRVYVTKNS